MSALDDCSTGYVMCAGTVYCDKSMSEGAMEAGDLQLQVCSEIIPSMWVEVERLQKRGKNSVHGLDTHTGHLHVLYIV